MITSFPRPNQDLQASISGSKRSLIPLRTSFAVFPMRSVQKCRVNSPHHSQPLPQSSKAHSSDRKPGNLKPHHLKPRLTTSPPTATRACPNDRKLQAVLSHAPQTPPDRASRPVSRSISIRSPDTYTTARGPVAKPSSSRLRGRDCAKEERPASGWVTAY